ncbi:TPA: major capsid protein [Klebsiella pneumoniae]
MSTAYEQLLVEKIIDFGDSFSDVKQPNNVITSLNLFGDENLSINKVLNDRLVEDADRVNSENAPYVHSDFNTTELPTFDSHFVELRTFKRVDKISSRSFEQARGFGKTLAETMDDQIAKYLIEHDIAYQNTLETILAESVLAGKQSGVYTAQGDLNYFSEFNQTKSSATFDFSSTSNVLAQLDAVQRQIRQAARSKLNLCRALFVYALAIWRRIWHTTNQFLMLLFTQLLLMTQLILLALYNFTFRRILYGH